jgi:hypothetical protein
VSKQEFRIAVVIFVSVLLIVSRGAISRAADGVVKIMVTVAVVAGIIAAAAGLTALAVWLGRRRQCRPGVTVTVTSAGQWPVTPPAGGRRPGDSDSYSDTPGLECAPGRPITPGYSTTLTPRGDRPAQAASPAPPAAVPAVDEQEAELP